MNLQTRILAPFVGALLLFTVIVLVAADRFGESFMRMELDAIHERQDKLFDQLTNETTGSLESLLYAVAANDRLAEAMTRRDRAQLYQLSRPLLDEWGKLSHVTHFYFHTPDRHNFLRVHLEARHGDLIGRRSMIKAATTGEVAASTEVGLTGEWVRRVVMPWRYRGRLIGYIELGADIEAIYARAYQGTEGFQILALDKTLIEDPGVWEMRRKQLQLSPYGWDALPDRVVVIQSGTTISETDLGRLFSLAGEQERKASVDIGDTRYIVKFEHVMDTDNGSIIGLKAFALQDAAVRATIGKFYLQGLLVFLVLLAMVFAASYSVLRKTQNRLDTESDRMNYMLDMKTRELRDNQARLIEAKDKAEAANRAKTVFLTNMSHELRTPMHGVLSMINIAKKRMSDEKGIKYLENAKSSAHRLSKILNDVVDIAYIESNRVSLAREAFSFASIARNQMGLFASKAKDKGLVLDIDFAEELAERRFLGDPVKLEQVFSHLIDNAIKFSDAGTVEVHGTMAENGESDCLLRFEVRDQGIGIEENDRAYLFNLFEQVDGSTTRKYGGSGLGLSMCEKLLGMMGGAIGVDSVPGQGSTFWFTVRLAKA